MHSVGACSAIDEDEGSGCLQCYECSFFACSAMDIDTGSVCLQCCRYRYRVCVSVVLQI